MFCKKYKEEIRSLKKTLDEARGEYVKALRKLDEIKKTVEDIKSSTDKSEVEVYALFKSYRVDNFEYDRLVGVFTNLKEAKKIALTNDYVIRKLSLNELTETDFVDVFCGKEGV